MKIKKYRVMDMKEALRLIKQELGSDAVILSTRKIQQSDSSGLFAREILEVTAAVDYEDELLMSQREAIRPKIIRSANIDESAAATREREEKMRRMPRSGSSTSTQVISERRDNVGSLSNIALQAGQRLSDSVNRRANDRGIDRNVSNGAQALTDKLSITDRLRNIGRGRGATVSPNSRDMRDSKEPRNPRDFADLDNTTGLSEQKLDGTIPSAVPNVSSNIRDAQRNLRGAELRETDLIGTQRGTSQERASTREDNLSSARSTQRVGGGQTDTKEGVDLLKPSDIYSQYQDGVIGKNRRRPEVKRGSSALADDDAIDKLAELLDNLGLDKLSAVADDIVDIKNQLNKVQNMLDEPSNVAIDLHDKLKDQYAVLVKNGVDELLAYRFLKAIERNVPSAVGNAHLKNILIERLSGIIPLEKGYLSVLNKKVIAFVGPTGVGKTTTIAKIAAELVLKYAQKVCLVTIDNFRIGAVEQLKTYADIVNLPLYVAANASELKDLIDDVQGEYDYVLLDSTGRSPYDIRKLDELSDILSVSSDIITVLVLSMAANHVELGDMFERYSSLSPEYLVFTKLDETRYFGPLINLPIKKKIPLLLLSTGQAVPDDMEVPDGKKIARILLQEIPTLWNSY